jgi:O-antigen ligase/polysaccharide polymerase Wzy-like membrane protein
MIAISNDIKNSTAPTTEESDGLPVLEMEGGRWSYFFSLLFLATYFIRPQDWVPGLAGFNIIRPIILLWGFSLLSEGLHSPLPGIFSTAHDWAMLIFYGYVVWTAPGEAGAGSGMFSLVIFYYLTTQALTSWKKLWGYLRVWNWLLIILAVLGVLQTMGIDITQGREITEYGKGRLALGTWTCNNPNALGHTVVVAIPLSYMLFFWKNSKSGRFVVFPAAMICILTCAWHTQSKGSYLVGAMLSVLVFVIGRPKWVQVIVLTTVLTAGVGTLSFLPRMESMGSLRSEEGVMGRLMAWEKARDACENNTTGLGWRQFHAWITVKDGMRWVVEDKSTHSSYVQIGADLGKPGMCLWLLVLFTSMRGVLLYRTQNEDEERCRRSVLLILMAYMVSSWMINREYHTEYYLIAAMAAAYHRLATASRHELAAATSDAASEAAPRAELAWQLPSEAETPWMQHEAVDVSREWLKLDWKDIATACGATWAVLQVWDYVLKNL